jgi:hypothetical protein
MPLAAHFDAEYEARMKRAPEENVQPPVSGYS